MSMTSQCGHVIQSDREYVRWTCQWLQRKRSTLNRARWSSAIVALLTCRGYEK